MLHGERVDLRNMRDTDPESFYDLYHGDVERRGPGLLLSSCSPEYPDRLFCVGPVSR